jgi:hypothetical protein
MHNFEQSFNFQTKMDSATFNNNATSLCAGGCGFFGSAPLSNMCSVCFKRSFGEDEFKRRLHASAPKSPVAAEAPSSPTVSIETATVPPLIVPPLIETSPADQPCILDARSHEDTPQAAVAPAQQDGGSGPSGQVEEAKICKPANRCTQCSRKVGLTGFGCRCGGTFCSAHRYVRFQ